MYVGEFKNGKRHGKGKWAKDRNNQNLAKYEGSYINDK